MVGRRALSLETYHSGRITPLYFRKSVCFVVVWQRVKAIGESCQTLRARPMPVGRLRRSDRVAASDVDFRFHATRNSGAVRPTWA